MAAGEIPPELGARTLVADLGFRCVLVEPDVERAQSFGSAELASTVDPSFATTDADVVVTDHDRPELGDVLKAALETNARWIGVMGSPRHAAQHIPALQSLGVTESDIARVHRPIGLNIGSKAPAEIAISTLAGLIADRNQRPGGFDFASRAASAGRQ
jgi:xanthine dehydrogenase accessory factor